MKILIAVIAYNEEQNIATTLKDLIDHNFGYDIVVIDNGSYDNTVQICEEMGIKVVSHCVNTGSSYGTIMTYFLYAYLNNYDILCQFDADGQHYASEIPKVIDPIKNNEADYMLGSRFFQKEGFKSYFFRRIGIKLFSFLVSKIIGQKITDVTQGHRAYGKKTIDFFAKYFKHGLDDTSQLLLLSHFIGARIREVPIKMRDRQYGKSEYNFLKSITFPLKGVVNIIGCYLQKNSIKTI